ncbi:hypothetical protein BKA60DRAFT_656988 [Fusarium oxysporum]|nr:hypothetical protein BKA60DRAFT_656988 [Fusarium oxysporum]
MTDEKANQIIATGTAWKILAWKSTAVFKEALIDGHVESEVRKACTYVRESIKQFNGTYSKALEVRQRSIQFLGQRTKLCWYWLMLRYHLSTLMLVDIIEPVGRCDLLPGFAQAIADAENAVIDALDFSPNNTYAVGARYGSSSKSVEELQSTEPVGVVDPFEAIVKWNGRRGLVDESIMSAVV